MGVEYGPINHLPHLIRITAWQRLISEALFLPTMFRVSVGVPAYNEEGNIRRSLESILAQDTAGHELLEVIVVSSGSTDSTDDIVRSMAEQDPRIRLLVQKGREGKASANNLFMSSARGDVLIQLNADAFISPDAFKHLLAPLSDPEVGAVTGRLAPVNNGGGFFAFTARLMFHLHHGVSAMNPKMTELFAIRNLDLQMPRDVNTDEDWLAHTFYSMGYRIVYAPDAVTNLKGADNIRDFLNQRVRVNIGENYMKRRFNYRPPTKDKGLVFNSLLDFIREERPNPFLLFGAMLLESMARVYSKAYVALGFKDQAVWKVIDSTKRH